jgi:hypothetical protein
MRRWFTNWYMTCKIRRHPDWARHVSQYKEAIRTGAIFKGLPHQAALGIRDSLVEMYGEEAVGAVPRRGRHLPR